MSTICCMLHLLGKRLGQKGSTLYTGGFCACAAGGATRAPKNENAIATAEVLVHLPFSNVYSFPSPLSPPCSPRLFSASSVLNSEKLNTEATKNHGEPQSSRAATKMCAQCKHFDGYFYRPSSPIHFRVFKVAQAVTRADAAGPFRLHFSGQIFEPVSPYPLHRCRCSPWNPWRSHRSNGTAPPSGRCRRSSPQSCRLCGHGSRSCRSCRLQSVRTFAARHE